MHGSARRRSRRTCGRRSAVIGIVEEVGADPVAAGLASCAAQVMHSPSQAARAEGLAGREGLTCTCQFLGSVSVSRAAGAAGSWLPRRAGPAKRPQKLHLPEVQVSPILHGRPQPPQVLQVGHGLWRQPSAQQVEPEGYRAAVTAAAGAVVAAADAAHGCGRPCRTRRSSGCWRRRRTALAAVYSTWRPGFSHFTRLAEGRSSWRDRRSSWTCRAFRSRASLRLNRCVVGVHGTAPRRHAPGYGRRTLLVEDALNEDCSRET